MLRKKVLGAQRQRVYERRVVLSARIFDKLASADGKTAAT
jgi:hypothetical protein